MIISLCTLIINSFVVSPSHAACTTAIISGHPNYPPYQWKQGKEIVGASIDIAKRIFQEKGITVQTPYVGPWKRVLKSAEQGKIDMIVALKNTAERRNYLKFNDTAFYINPFVVWVTADSDIKFEQWEDLTVLRGTKNAGDRYGEKFDKFVKQKLSLHQSNDIVSNYRLLMNNRVDYYIHGLYPGRALLAINQMQDHFKYLPNPINKGYIHNGFSRESDCQYLNDYFNQRLAELAASGDIKTAMEENLIKWQEQSPK